MAMTITVPKCSGLTPSCAAIGVSNGPKMMSAGAPSRMAPNTIMISTESITNMVLPHACANSIMNDDRYCGICWIVSANERLDAAATMNRMLPAIEAERTNSRATDDQVSSRKASQPTTSA